MTKSLDAFRTLRARRVVLRVFTDLAVFDVEFEGASMVEMVEGLTIDELRSLIGVPLAYPAEAAA